MPGRKGFMAVLPWVLCWISLGLLFAAVWIRIARPERPDDSLLQTAIQALGVALVPLVGALIAARLPTNPYGWVWCGLGLAFGVLAAGDGLTRMGLTPSWLTGLLSGVSYLSILCLLVFVILLFPTGRLPGRSWRWLARAAVVLPGVGLLILPFVPVAVDDADPTPWAVGGGAGGRLVALLDLIVTSMLILVAVAALSVLLRFRRAGPVERQQLKWFLLAVSVAAVTAPLDFIDIPIDPSVYGVVDAISFALLPTSVGIAVLRYRLYEIDRIISRTVSYGLLTGGLVALYFAVVTVLRPVLEPVTGSSALAVAGSTLAVAAVFSPARRRLQTAVDRRFDRAGYDAARVVDAFAARLRDQVDLDEVSAGLRDTVTATVAPLRVGVWLRHVPTVRGV